MDMTKMQQAYMLGRENEYKGGKNATHFYYEFKMNTDIDKFENALNRLIAGQSILRSIFVHEKLQRLEHVPKFEIKNIQVSDEDEYRSFIEETRVSYQGKIRDVSKWPLFDLFFVTRNDIGQQTMIVDFDMMLMDGMSVYIFINQLNELYKNSETVLEDYNFEDYLSMLDTREYKEKYEKDREFWTNKAGNMPQAPALPYKALPDEDRANTFKRKTHFWGFGDYRRLKRAARKYAVTTSTVLLALYAWTLKYWSENQNFTINVTAFGRPEEKRFQKMIGDFTVNFLQEFSFETEKSLETYLNEVNEKMFLGFDHKSFEGTETIREISKQQGVSINGLMPVVFTSMLYDDDAMGIEEMEMLYGISQTSQVMLDNQVLTENRGFRVQWDYLAKVFTEEMIDDIFDFYVKSINTFITREELIGNEEVPGYDAIMNVNATECNREMMTLSQLIQSGMELYPENVAIVDENGEWNYRQLKNVVGQLMELPEFLEIQSGERVVVRTNRSKETIAVILAVVLSGGVYIPVPEEFPESRASYIIEHSKSSKKLVVDEMFHSISCEKEYGEIIGKEVSLDASAYIIYTSGSTGNPKGVEISHGQAMVTILDIYNRCDFSQKDIVLGLSEYSFDLSVYDIFGTIGKGATLLVVKDRRETREIWKWLTEYKVTFWNSVPMILELALADKNLVREIASMKSILLSGDWIPVTLPQRAWKVFTQTKIWSLGGATEAAIWSIQYPISPKEAFDKHIPYGTALDNQKIFVMDPSMNIKPRNCMGEIVIGGQGVAKGYYNEPELTKRAFINTQNFGRVYRTGDYGYFDSEKNVIMFCGRRDNQVKINGFRIELEEIEGVAKVDELVEDAIATVVEIGAGKSIILFVKSSEDVKAAIMERCRKKLPSYMVPRDVEVVESFPMSFNNKVDVNALAEGYHGEKRVIVEPVDEYEMLIYEIWKENLDMEEISVDDNFFEIGGDSLRAIKIRSDIAERSGVNLSVGDMMDSQTIRELAEIVREEKEYVEEFK